MQNISFILFATRIVSVMVKQKIDAVIKNPYFKLLANDITPSIVEEFSLEKIESNI